MAMAPIAEGDIVPDGNLSFVNEQDEFESVSIYSLITGKKVLMIGLPGAFMPDCRWWYKRDRMRMAFHRRWMQQTLFITVNDPYVAQIWAKIYFPSNFPNVKFLADSKAAYVTSLGFNEDLASHGFGVRTRRFLMIVEDRKVVRLSRAPIFLDPLLSLLERPTPTISRAPIAVGDIIPDGVLTFINQQNQIEPMSVHSIVTGKKVIVLGVRGAFLPTCCYLVSKYIEKEDDFKLMGVQEILCVSVNDPYVMRGWQVAYYKDTTDINFLADSTAEYVASLGLIDDLSGTEYGIRSKRFTMLLEDCRVKVFEVHSPGNFDMLMPGNMLVAMAGAEFRAMEV